MLFRSRGQRVHQVLHARRGVGRVAAFGILADQHLEGVEGFARGLGIALGEILQADMAEQADVLVEVGQPLQVVGVVDVGMVGVEADGAVSATVALVPDTPTSCGERNPIGGDDGGRHPKVLEAAHQPT